MIPRWKLTRKYCSSNIPVIKGLYKTPFFTEYKVIMLFLPRGICSKRQNTLYMVWILPHPRVKVSIVGSLRDREVACSASDRQGSNFESCVWRTVSSQSSHHPQEVLLAQFSLYVHKGGLKPDSFHFISFTWFEYTPERSWPSSTQDCSEHSI